MTTREVRISAAHTDSPSTPTWFNIPESMKVTTDTIYTVDNMPTRMVITRV